MLLQKSGWDILLRRQQSFSYFCNNKFLQNNQDTIEN